MLYFSRCQHCFHASLTLSHHTATPAGAVTPVRTCGRHTAVEAGPSRIQTLLSSAGERASARRCRNRKMKAARCMASWKSTRYRRDLGRAGPAGLCHCESRVQSGPQEAKGGNGWRIRGNIPYRWPETSTLPPGRASSSPTCTVSDPASAGEG